jgi:NAD(P)-dependent dehydrogenase (short-subunit alcohol dehydrogenase family)
VSADARLDGRVALVTGAASGIGLATARALLDAGARVVAVDVQEPPGDLDATYVAADVRSGEDWARVVETAERELGGLDFAHLNAGIALGEPDITAIADADVARILDINVDGVVLGARAVIPAMRRRGGGAIVATASLAGLIAFAPDPLYTLTKHAVVGLVRALAEPLRGDGITINAVCPGIVDTPILSAEARDAILAAGFPLIEPADIAAAVLGRFAGPQTGEAWVCQHGREPVAYEFRGVPGPAEHERPPAGLGDPEVTI